MRQWCAYAALATAVAAGCGDDSSEAPAPPPPRGSTESAGASAGGPAAGRTLSFDVEDATVAEVARSLATTAGATVVIDPNAQAVADCARITVATSRPVPLDDLFEVVRIGLLPAGITLERTPQGVILRRDPDAPLPATCRPRADLPRLPTPGGSRDQESDQERTERQQLLERGIRARSETAYLISEEAASALMEPNAMMRSARIIPHQEGGRVVGLKVYGVRRNSALGLLGIRNGDMIQSVNGLDLTNPEAALEAYSRLRGQDRYNVQIVRRGQPVELTYRVVPRLP